MLRVSYDVNSNAADFTFLQVFSPVQPQVLSLIKISRETNKMGFLSWLSCVGFSCRHVTLFIYST